MCFWFPFKEEVYVSFGASLFPFKEEVYAGASLFPFKEEVYVSIGVSWFPLQRRGLRKLWCFFGFPFKEEVYVSFGIFFGSPSKKRST